MQRYIRLNLCPGGIALEGSEKCGAGYTAGSNYKNEFRSREPPKRRAGRFQISGLPRREEKKARPATLTLFMLPSLMAIG
ncbi:MAG: hypothetical protein ABSE08_09395 [Syntrophobacteraceae bacterium]|jgi:hypothetical protein